MIAIAFLASCNKEYAEPVITWAGADSKVIDFSTGNYTIELDVEIDAEGTIEDFKIWKIPYIGDDPAQGLSELIDTGEEWKGLLAYVYEFNQTVIEAEFAGGVTKIDFEFVVKDEQEQETTAIYTVTRVEAYTVTFTVKDGMGNDIDDAVVTFNEVENEAGDYTFTYVIPGTFDYTVAKAGYIAATGNIEVAANVTEDVVLYQNLTAYSDIVILANQTWATYNGQAAHGTESAAIGVQWKSTNANLITIETTQNCDGWVIVDDISTVTHYHDLYNIFNHDDAIILTEMALTVNDVNFQKNYTPIFFVSKIGNNYVLVRNVDGIRDGINGNTVVFDYKTKVSAK